MAIYILEAGRAGRSVVEWQLMDAPGCKSLNRLCLAGLTVIALSCLMMSGGAATITYPNRAYIFSNGTFEPVPGFGNIKALAVEDNYVLGVTRDGRVISSGLPERWLPHEHLEQLSNIVAVGLSAVQAAALTADGRVIDLEAEPRWPQPPGLTNVIAWT